MNTSSDVRSAVRWSPESRAGRWAVVAAGCSLAGVVLLVLGFTTGVVVMADSYGDSWGQALWGLFIWVSAMIALVAGFVAVRLAHDHSRLVLAAIIVGLLPPVLLISEVALGKF